MPKTEHTSINEIVASLNKALLDMYSSEELRWKILRIPHPILLENPVNLFHHSGPDLSVLRELGWEIPEDAIVLSGLSTPLSQVCYYVYSESYPDKKEALMEKFPNNLGIIEILGTVPSPYEPK